jgi:hypothetical protein
MSVRSRSPVVIFAKPEVLIVAKDQTLAVHFGRQSKALPEAAEPWSIDPLQLPYRCLPQTNFSPWSSIASPCKVSCKRLMRVLRLPLNSSNQTRSGRCLHL